MAWAAYAHCWNKTVRALMISASISLVNLRTSAHKGSYSSFFAAAKAEALAVFFTATSLATSVTLVCWFSHSIFVLIEASCATVNEDMAASHSVFALVA